ncbi:MAG TPA: hypothetical protein VLV86_05140 [Vicinamibacterales bacterium]|nr:hypothetical protein [Thermoanaerobaculia bacterium]HUK33270.1 hypothetical protein [Vicinamibacterales bacterium]
MRHFLVLCAAFVALRAPADISGITVSPITLPAQTTETIVGPDGNLWWITYGGKIGKLTHSGTYTEFALPFGTDSNNIPYAQALTTGPDANIWVAAFNGHIERITTAGTVTDFTVAPSFFTSAIVSSPDNALWFWDRQNFGPGVSLAWKLGRIDVFGNVTSYDVGFSGDQLTGLISGGDGNLWFIDATTSQLVRFSLATNTVDGKFAIPSPSSGDDDKTVLGWDGNVWFSRGTSIDRATPDGTITEFHVPSGGKPAAVVMGGDGNIWFTEPSSNSIGQLVLSSVTAGGSATINESAGILPGVYEMTVLPPAFASFPVTAHSLEVAQATAPCPPITFLGKNSFTGQQQQVVFPIPQCADIVVGLPVAQQRGASAIRIIARIGNNGPHEATAYMIVSLFAFLQFNIADATFPTDPNARCDIGQPQPGSIECQIPLQPGEAHDVNVDLTSLSVSPAQAAFFTRVSGFSDLPDPDLSNNVQVRFVLLNSPATLPSNGTAPVATPPVAPGFKPCIVNAGSVGAVGPCFGPPGTTITLEMSQTVPGGPGTLVFKNAQTSNTPADVTVPVTPVAGSTTIYNATAPPQLCAGSFPHTWNVWLTDANGGNQGEIGQFSMTNCN